MRRARLALVPGEPAGVGPELALQALTRDWDADLVVIGDLATLRDRADALGHSPQLLESRPGGAGRGAVALHDIPNAVRVAPGAPDPANAAAVTGALLAGADGCLAGRFDGLVTGPVHKATINEGGIAYSGTTELLARHAGTDVVMMLANDVVRVALATTHLPLRDVADQITPALLERTLAILAEALRRDFGIEAPLVAVLGLNPHAGEAGHLGREELDVIAPAMARLRTAGLRLEGPLPADTAFLPANLARFDAVLAMYHDQGLPVLKYSGFERAVNMTLGLPYPRVAVDHGTAFDLAGTGRADPSSLLEAVAACGRLARQRMQAGGLAA